MSNVVREEEGSGKEGNGRGFPPKENLPQHHYAVVKKLKMKILARTLMRVSVLIVFYGTCLLGEAVEMLMECSVL
jgi:hypothetical protein